MASNTNVGRVDQIARIIRLELPRFAVFCPSAVSPGAFDTWPSAIVRAILPVTGLTRRCPAYCVIRMNTER